MRKIFPTWLGITMISCLLLGKSLVFANTRPTAEEFPEKTIIIGTYAIALDVVNEELLEVALQSAETNMQNEVYFKSDVNRGVWYNITKSSSISDISETTTNIVKNQDIDSLYLTHYTNASGVTICFETDSKVYVSDINTPQMPTNIVELDELENELKVQQALYDSVKDEPEEESDKEEEKRLEKKAIYSEKINSLKRVLEEIKNKEVDKLTAQIRAVENLERQLVQKGADSEKIEMIVAQKDELKNTRMAYCYQILIDKMNEENISIDYEDCNDLIQKYASAITSLQAIISELGVATDKVASSTGEDDSIDETFSENQPSGEVVEEEATGIDKIMEENLALMLEAAENGNFEQAEEALEEAYVAETVKNNDNNVSDEIKEKQKEILSQTIELLGQEALELVQAGDGESYKEAVKNQESNTVLEAMKEERIGELNDLLTQLEDTYASLGEKTEEALEQANLLQQEMETYEKLLNAIPTCEIEESLKELLQDKLSYAEEQLNEVKLQSIPEYQQTASLIENVTVEVELLNEKYLEAIEENNIEDSKQYKAELDAALEKLVNAENKLEQLEKDFMEGNLKSDLELGETTSTEESKEKKEDILEDLENVLSGEDSRKEISRLLEELGKLEKESLNDSDTLEEAIAIMEQSLLDLEKVLKMMADVDEKKKELLQEKLQQTEEKIECLEEYFDFITETNQTLEQQLEETTEKSKQVAILTNGKDTYQQKLDEVEKTLSQGIQDCIKNALQKEIDALTNQMEILQEEGEESSFTKEEQAILEDYLVFIKETNETLEQQLEKTTDSSKRIEIFNSGKENYEEKITEIDNTLTQELQDCITEALETEIDKINKQIEALQINEERNDLLTELAQVVSKEDDSLEKVSDLLEDFMQIEMVNLEQTEGLEEAIDVVEEFLSNLEELLKNADTQKEGTKLLEETAQQTEQQLDLLNDYLDFIEDTNQKLEKQLAKTTDIFKQKDVLVDTKDIYKEKLKTIDNSLEQELKDCITEALQEEIDNITKKEQELQEKIDERLAEILGDKSDLSQVNKALAKAQEDKYSPEELDEIATLTDNLRAEYEEKGAELIYPWLIIFEDYDVKLTLPAIRIKEEIYVPVEELALQLGADVLKSKTNDVIVIKGRSVLIEYILNDNVVYVNDKKMTVTLPPAKEIKNQVYISLQCFVRAYRLEEASYDFYSILSEK